jgi:hypothetical protein
MGMSGGVGNYTFENNLLIYNTNGLNLGNSNSAPLVQDNTIDFSQVGISSSAPNTNITNNNIENCSQNSIHWGSLSNLNAPNNWWGTTDASAISQSIYDYKNNYNLGNVTFTPFLSAPNSQAPLISSFSVPNQLLISSPSPTSTPSQTPISNSTSPLPTPTTASTNQTAKPTQTIQSISTATPAKSEPNRVICSNSEPTIHVNSFSGSGNCRFNGCVGCCNAP